MKEIWKPVKGFFGYQVSNLGQVRSFHKRGYGIGLSAQPKLLSPGMRGGYLSVVLCKRGTTFNKPVHLLVLTAFVGKRPLGMVGAHLDGDVLNNRLTNLKWATPIENENHKKLHGTYTNGERSHKAKLTQKEVDLIRKNFIPGTMTYAEVGNQFGVDQTTIGCIIRRKTWKGQEK